MKKQRLLCLMIFFATSGTAQTPYWQQQVDYNIQTNLVDSNQRLNANMDMRYFNNSPDTLHYIWMHLWQNAFKNDRTAFSDQLLQNGRTDFYFADEEERGYINNINFSVDGILASTNDHPKHQDIVQLMLPTPLPPNASVSIKTAFHVKLPKYFSRTGFLDSSYMITHWYPKAAVYDKNGWHEMPYLNQGEFYSNFGDYDVQITAPQAYSIAATGKKIEETSNDGHSNTFRFIQKNVVDFAWFAHPSFVVQMDTINLETKTVNIFVYRYKSSDSLWKNAIDFTKNAIRTKSNLLGEYPYETVSVVQGPSNATSAGMEYPTICLISGANSEQSLNYLINHEVGHNWFYGILASNERSFPWMDEGMNSYYDRKYMLKHYGKEDLQQIPISSAFLEKRIPDDLSKLILQSIIRIKKDQAIETAAADFSPQNYSMIAYTKAALWMQQLEKKMGTATFESAMKSYYKNWQFKHPEPADFEAEMKAATSISLDSTFDLLHQKGTWEPRQQKQIKVQSFFGFKDTEKYNYLYYMPAVGYNHYDGIMPGIALHNYTLPAPAFRFFVVPMYGIQSKKLNGTARLSYDHFFGSNGNRLQLAVAASKFTVDNFKDSTGKVNAQPYHKIVPSLKYVFANSNPRSQVYSYIQWKTFFIQETGLSFKRDTINHVNVISYPTTNSYINQLKFSYENNRVLYPFKGTIQIDQGEKFIRAGFTGNYYFNYVKKGGLNLRLFAGKFMYLQDKTFSNRFYTDKYHLNLSAAKGYEDFTYSNYFIGRNEFDGFSNQQVMIRDGAFKVRTDLLANKIGKTDNWLAALNLTSTIPNSLNPLSVLPIDFPLKIFVDIGTYAEAWEKDAATGKFLYDAGIQLSIWQNSIHIYVPLLYSKVYNDYFKSTIPENRFLKNISFSIDFNERQLRKMVPILNL